MTKFFLISGVVGPAFFIIVFLMEGFIRQGYDPRRHYVSSLSLGKRGWIQVVNFIICGISMLVFSISFLGTQGSGLDINLVTFLLCVFGIGLIVSGIFATDPVLGYPPETQNASPSPMASQHGKIHDIAGLIVFTSLPIAAFIMAFRFIVQEGEIGWGIYSAVTGISVLFLFFTAGALAAKASQGVLSNPPVGLYQRASIITGWSWIIFLAWHLLQG